MSMLSEQVKNLRKMSIRQRNNAKVSEKVFLEIENALHEAADTIEALSAKLANENMERSERYCNGGWILCSDRLPNKTDSYLVVTYSDGISSYIADVDHFIYNGMPDGHWINGEDVVAWQPMPEIPEQYKPQ